MEDFILLIHIAALVFYSFIIIRCCILYRRAQILLKDDFLTEFLTKAQAQVLLCFFQMERAILTGIITTVAFGATLYLLIIHHV